jgi:hypothetical protein
LSKQDCWQKCKCMLKSGACQGGCYVH